MTFRVEGSSLSNHCHVGNFEWCLWLDWRLFSGVQYTIYLSSPVKMWLGNSSPSLCDNVPKRAKNMQFALFVFFCQNYWHSFCAFFFLSKVCQEQYHKLLIWKRENFWWSSSVKRFIRLMSSSTFCLKSTFMIIGSKIS